jgi:hypothetical protein
MKTRVVAMLLSPLLWAPTLTHAAELKPETIKAWDEYIRGANARMAGRVHGAHFLWTDESPDRLNRVRQGEVVVSHAGERAPQNVAHGLIHDWIGAAFIPNVRIDDLFSVVRDYGRYKDFYRPSVVDSKPLPQAGEKDERVSGDRFSMVLLNQSLFLKKALESEYQSSYIKVDGRRWYGVSYSTRIQEIENFGRAAQRKLPPDTGSGLIWRLYSFSRFEERDGGVYVEMEAIALSREIPFSVRWMVEPIVRRVSRSSILTSLNQTSEAVRTMVAKGDRPRRDPVTVSVETAPAPSSFSKSFTGRH